LIAELHTFPFSSLFTYWRMFTTLPEPHTRV
jgi:hypothetical protein